MYTSLKLSRLLQEKLFSRETGKWLTNNEVLHNNDAGFLSIESVEEWNMYGQSEINYLMDRNQYEKGEYEFYITYDILNDLCVTHAKELFGENYEAVTDAIFWLTRKGNVEKAESRIIENLII